MAWLPRPSRPQLVTEAAEAEPKQRRIAPMITGFPTRRAAARALYRIFNATRYDFFASSSGPPSESDSPFASSASLPHTPADTFADGTWYLSVRYFNGVLSSGFLPVGPHGETYLTVEIAGGVALGNRPSAPLSVRLEQRAGGVVRILAFYSRLADAANAATQWAIAYTTNSSDPASDAPTLTPSVSPGPLSILAYDLPAQINSTIVKVQLQVRRGTVYSLPSPIQTLQVNTSNSSMPLSLQSWPGPLPEDL